MQRAQRARATAEEAAARRKGELPAWGCAEAKLMAWEAGSSWLPLSPRLCVAPDVVGATGCEPQATQPGIVPGVKKNPPGRRRRGGRVS